MDRVHLHVQQLDMLNRFVQAYSGERGQTGTKGLIGNTQAA